MPLSSSEHAQLQALLQKASEPVDAESTSSEGGFSLVTGSMCGAMTDGAKRRACSPVKEDSQSSEKLLYAGYEIAAHAHTRELMPGHAPDMEVPYVPKSSESPGGKITLPPSVLSVEQWSRTLITWGQYKGCGMSYQDLLERKDEKAVGYKKWCMARLNSAEGRLLDLTRFLLFCDRLVTGPALTQGPVIPGTSEVRQYK